MCKTARDNPTKISVGLTTEEEKWNLVCVSCFFWFRNVLSFSRSVGGYGHGCIEGYGYFRALVCPWAGYPRKGNVAGRIRLALYLATS